jgi:hypothetical protein
MTLKRTSGTGSIAALAGLTLLAAGCATDNTPAQKKATSIATVPITSANGEMNKYLGTWTSNCGREYQLTPDGKGALSSGINSFSFTSVSGNTVEGTLAIDSHESPDCSGPSKRTSAKIAMSYVGNVAVNSSFGEATLFTGSADKLTATVVSNGSAKGGNTFNIGFLEGFNKFQLAPLDYFSSTNLVYTRKP